MGRASVRRGKWTAKGEEQAGGALKLGRSEGAEAATLSTTADRIQRDIEGDFSINYPRLEARLEARVRQAKGRKSNAARLVEPTLTIAQNEKKTATLCAESPVFGTQTDSLCRRKCCWA